MELNSEQKQAVEHGEGPLLIIAGAGTGKTRVITSRILHLIEQGVKPSEILALTFTEKAANEMVERIDERMPLSYEELVVKTFHAFSEQILRESGLEMGLDPGYKILTQVEQWFFFKKNLFNFDLDYYRPLGNPNRFVYGLLSHFGSLKDELITPDEYIKYAEGLEGEEGEKVLELARAYKRYQELLLANNLMDFADLTYYAVQLLDKRESCLKKYREQYKYVLVDEFQDTNYAQFQLVLRLAGGHKNLTVVGDDDQSIYKWRGASLSNILQFDEHFPGAEKVVLNDNYRSSGNILDSAYKLICNNNPDRLEVKIGINKKLRCNSGDGAPVEVHEFADFLQEASFVADKIKFLHENDGCAYGDFALLVRANNQAYPFIEELKYRGIPFQVRNPKGLFSLEEIKDLIAVARVMANPYDDISLLRILKMDVFEVEMAEILELLNRGNNHLFDLLKSHSPTLPGTESGLERVAILLKELIDFSKKQSVGLLMNEFLQKSGHLNFLIDNERFEEVENINEFARQVMRFERNNEDRTVVDFVNYLNLLEEAGAVFEDSGYNDRDSVQILTTHGAKGLEFKNVFVVNTVKHRFPSIRRSDPFEVPQELTKEIYPEGDFHLQEERRLFYVAVTRAKERLFLTYSEQYEGTKSWKVSPFVEELRAAGRSEFIKHEAEGNAIARLKEFKEPKKPIFELPEFKGKRLSYSQLNTFETCPLQYNYRYLLKVPVSSSHAGNFGSSVHGTLNEFYQALKRGEEPSLELLKQLYDKNWIPYGYESMEHEQTRRVKGWEMLEAYFAANCDPWVKPDFLEKPFNLKVGDYWLSGRIDRIDRLDDGTYEVIDYKTGRLKDEKSLSKDLQLSIYALACQEVFHLSISKLTLYFLEDNQRISTERSAKQLEGLKDEIIEMIEKMKVSDFSAAPGFHCQFCDFRLICPAV